MALGGLVPSLGYGCESVLAKTTTKSSDGETSRKAASRLDLSQMAQTWW